MSFIKFAFLHWKNCTIIKSKQLAMVNKALWSLVLYVAREAVQVMTDNTTKKPWLTTTGSAGSTTPAADQMTSMKYAFKYYTIKL